MGHIKMHLKLVAFFTLVFGVVAMAFPMPDDPYGKPVYHAAPHDLGRVKIQKRNTPQFVPITKPIEKSYHESSYHHEPAYHDAPHDLGRVKIQVYRGPSENKGGYDSFAPWGFYVTQPKDLPGYH